MILKNKTDRLIKNKSFIYKFLLFSLSLVMGYLLYGFFSWLIIGNNKTEPDFFMKWYNTRKASNYHKPAFDTIVIVDADNLNRKQLAKMLYHLDSMQPKVIGFDLLLEEKRDRYDDSVLLAIKHCHPNIILPVYLDEKGSLRAPFFKKNVHNKNDQYEFSYGSVVFDDPWNTRTRQGDYYSFAYLVAKMYLGKEIDTSTFIVDYSPMTLNERIYYDTVARSFMYLDLQINDKTPKLSGKIVLIGTLDRTVDAVSMSFPVRYDELYKPQYVIPGMISLSYEIRSLVDEGHRIKKMGVFLNLVLNICLIVMYLWFYERFRSREEKFKRVYSSKRWLYVFMPLLGLALIILLEWLLVMAAFFITDQSGWMPNLGVFMATLPVVKTADDIVSRLYEI